MKPSSFSRARSSRMSRASAGSAPRGWRATNAASASWMRDADFARAGFRADRRQRREFENIFGEDRVRVAPQALDAGDAKRRGRSVDRRARLRAVAIAIVSFGRSSAAAIASIASPRFLQSSKASPASADRRAMKREGTVGAPSRLMARLSTTRSGAQSHDEVMRALADASLRRHQAELGAHGAIEKGAGVRLRRPYAFVESGEQDEIGLDEPRFQRTEDLQARMGASRTAQQSSRRRRGRRAPHSLARRSPPAPQRARAGREVRTASTAPSCISFVGAGDHRFKRAAVRARAVRQRGRRRQRGEGRESGVNTRERIFDRAPVVVADAARRRMRMRRARHFARRRDPRRPAAVRLRECRAARRSRRAARAMRRARAKVRARVSGCASSAATFTAPARSDPIVATSRASAPMDVRCERHAAGIVDLNVEASQLGGDAPRDDAGRA